MRPVVRGSVNKSRSVRQFRKNSARTKRANVSIYPMRGGYRDWETDRKSTRLNSSHITRSRMPSSA